MSWLGTLHVSNVPNGCYETFSNTGRSVSGVNVLVRPNIFSHSTSFRLQVMDNLRIPIPCHLPPSVLLIPPHRHLSLMSPRVPTSQVLQNLLPSLALMQLESYPGILRVWVQTLKRSTAELSARSCVHSCQRVGTTATVQTDMDTTRPRTPVQKKRQARRKSERVRPLSE
ncbi:hypothetical protein BDR07DRAFT_605346 [Suillus spraguei]|nr:hypothetical protein BDR07DRAFT_605346 [Suillus spraguei]